MYTRYVAKWLPSYGVKKDSLKKNSQREVTQKLRKGEQSFLWATTIFTSYTLL